jgi:hypothetical protein
MSFDERDQPRTLDPGQAFLPLEPPPGGLIALRARLDRGRERRWVPVTALAALATVVLLAGVRGPRPGPRLLDQAGAEHYPSLVSLGLVPPPAEPVTRARGEGAPLALRRVPVNTPALVLYLSQPDRPANAADRR